MNDEVKEILIDLIGYYNTMGTKEDPGIHVFESVAQRASKALERHKLEGGHAKNSADVDPFAMDVTGRKGYAAPGAILKHENDF
tara:strand:+ start:247 stop:498 length:252 start_codon:yes stop_codon:yes gene_type:complete